MKFRTEIEVSKELDLKPDFRFMTFGSCFANRMGAYFDYLGLQSYLNPFGVIYNPVSISNLLNATLENKTIGLWEELNGMWLNTMYHGQFNSSQKDIAVEELDEVTRVTHKKLQETDLLVITLGTSYAYRDVESSEVVTNCHRLPTTRFMRELLSIDEMEDKLKGVLQAVFKVNSVLKVVITVSPVRHVRDSLVKNQLSKSQLICLVHLLEEQIDNVLYFPSYEILMDDLRDYRFYDESLVQPSSQALKYIQEKFRIFAFSQEMYSYESEALKLLKKLSHRPINENEQTEQFRQKCESELKNFMGRYPFSSIGSRTQ